MPRPGKNMVHEKSKDFKGSMKRLIGNLRPWKFIMFLSLFLAMTSAILSLIAPDKLSQLTDTITAGISPNKEKLELIGTEISKSFEEDKMQTKMQNLYIEVELTEEEIIKINDVFKQLK